MRPGWVVTNISEYIDFSCVFFGKRIALVVCCQGDVKPFVGAAIFDANGTGVFMVYGQAAGQLYIGIKEFSVKTPPETTVVDVVNTRDSPTG